MRTLLRFFAPSLCLIGAASAQSLLVVNQGNATVSVLDPASGRVTAVLSEHLTSVHGHEIAATPDGHTAFVPVYGSSGVGKPGIDGHQILVFDLPSRKMTGTIDLGHATRPHLPVYSPTTGLLYVTTELDRTVTVLDPIARKVLDTIPTGQDQSHMLVLSHDGRRGYTANVGPGTVSVLDLTSRKLLAIWPVAPQIQRISISNDDKLVFTSDTTQPRLAVLDTASGTVQTWVPLPGMGYGSAATPDGRSLLVAIPAKHQVAVVDLATRRVTRTIDVAAEPQEILLRPDGKVAYVSCILNGKVAEIDLSRLSVSRTLTAGPYADGLAWAP